MFAWMLPASPPTALRMSIIGAASCVIALAAVCWFQIGYWRDSSTLALRALDVTSKNFIAHTLLGNALVEAGRFEEGAAQLQEATRIEPTSPQAWHNLGFALAQLGLNEEAMQAYRTAITQRPNFAENHFNLGLLLEAAGRLDEARAALQRARELAGAAGDDALAAEANAQLEDLGTPE
jgi:Flp pilus assembly protein TadD